MSILREEGKERIIMAWSDGVRNRKFRLLGHIIRCNPRDPMYRITFQEGILQPNIPGARRVGRPRTSWVQSVKEAAWSTFSDRPFSNADEDNQEIMDRACFREAPFG